MIFFNSSNLILKWCWYNQFFFNKNTGIITCLCCTGFLFIINNNNDKVQRDCKTKIKKVLNLFFTYNFW